MNSSVLQGTGLMTPRKSRDVSTRSKGDLDEERERAERSIEDV